MARMSRRQALLDSPLFDGVAPEAAQMVERSVTERVLPAGETLINQEAAGEALYFLVSGVARVSRAHAGGRERLLGFLYAPAVVGEAAVLTQRGRGASVTAETELRVLMLYREHLQQLLGRHPQVLWNLARLLAERVGAQNDELIAMGASTEAAMAHAMLQLHAQRLAAGVPDPALLPITPVDLTARLSSSRETVSRLLRKFQTGGLVQTEGVHLRLMDLAALESLALGLDED